MQPIDRHPTLPKAIDIGSDRYYFGSEKPIELGYKTKKDFINAYGDDAEIEYLFRKYFPLDSDSNKIAFDSDEDKLNTIELLEKRAKNLKLSNEFTSSILSNTITQRIYLNIQKILSSIKGPSKASKELKSSQNFGKDKKYVESLTDEQILLILIEISFYLLHPDSVPDKIRSNWYSLIKALDTIRTEDLANKLKEIMKSDDAKPLNYFVKNTYFNEIKKSEDTLSALQSAIDMAKKIQDENATQIMRNRLEAILTVLQAKKYLNSVNTEINSNTVKSKLNKTLIENPMTDPLDKPLKEAFVPFMDYFKTVYDPVYGIIENSILKFKTKNSKSLISLSELLKTLEFMNKINLDSTKFGLIKLNGVDANVIKFIKQLTLSINNEIDNIPENSAKSQLKSQLSSLPKVKLSSVLGTTEGYKNPDEMPFVGLFTIGSNITLLEKPNLNSTMNDETKQTITKQLKNYFTENSLFLIKSKRTADIKTTQLSLYETDMSTFKVDKTPDIKTVSEIKFNSKPLEIKDAINIEEYNIINDSELSLAILIAFKELMPK